MRSIVNALTPDRKDRIVDALFESRLRAGYRIVALGGGTGLSTLLRGLKRHTLNITAVVTVSDDGGSSGRLQRELGILPPGDVRNCLVALADDEAMVTDLFRYRFHEGDGLSGHSFGNLFLAAMTGITGNFDVAVKESSRVLNIKGRVLPATLAVTWLRATMSDGRVIEGETEITQAGGSIKSISLEPAHAAPLAEVIEAIRNADAIVLGPGSLYTSIIPNLLVDRIAREVERSSAVKIFVSNVMTQPGETDGFSASKHLEVLLEHAGAKVCDYMIVNSQPPKRLRDLYAEEGQVWVEPDVDNVRKLGVRPIVADVIGETTNVRHDPERLAQVVTNLIDEAIADRATFVKRAPAPARDERPLLR
ncbi:MAG: YvcK family protein [Candidatus Eremiobacteraeota bacterium]|nr:YvcK family protein [Candidatus Eremiobacteraeota bacterium]